VVPLKLYRISNLSNPIPDKMGLYDTIQYFSSHLILLSSAERGRMAYFDFLTAGIVPAVELLRAQNASA
jgi:hypothetical protein